MYIGCYEAYMVALQNPGVDMRCLIASASISGKVHWLSILLISGCRRGDPQARMLLEDPSCVACHSCRLASTAGADAD